MSDSGLVHKKGRKIIGFLFFAGLAFLGRDIFFALQNDTWLSYQPYDILRNLDLLGYAPPWLKWLVTAPMSIICMVSAFLILVFGK